MKYDASMHLEDTVRVALNSSAKVITVPTAYPVPDFKYLNLGAPRL